MSPIDDELRAALHGRARVLDPSPDPLAGIEGRARRIQRNRAGAAVAGSVLAVAAVAGVVPLLQGASGPAPQPQVVASAPPTLEPSPEPSTSPPAEVSYALDPASPWAFRGEPVDEGTRATIQGEYATRLQVAEVLLTPLYASTYEPSGQQEVVFLARVDGSYRWGVSASTEAGPEFLWDEPLPQPALALAAHLPGDEVDRLLVLAAPGTGPVYYGTEGSDEHSIGGDGLAVAPLERDTGQDFYRVLADGRTLVKAPVPAPARAAGADAFAFDAADPWPYRGTEEPSAPNIGVEDERLFVESDPSRGDGSWSQRGLYAGDSDAGVSFLVVLHVKPGEDPVVTTTWQRGDRAAEQTEQRVEPGQRVIQSIVPTDLDDGSALLVALASPQAGIGLDQPTAGLREDGIGDPGVGLWILPEGERDGMIRLFDGPAEIYAEPVDVGPDAG